MQKSTAGVFYLDLPRDVMQLLRLSAARHGRCRAAEALALLGMALGLSPAAVEAGGVEYHKGDGFPLELPECLVAPLRSLADRYYRTIAGECAFLLQLILRQRQGAATTPESAPERSPGRPRGAK
jgi:hypothetical protein